MATRTQTTVVYTAGLVQGIVLVTFPAAGTIFTDPDGYAMSSSAYGALFLPQVITAIAGSLLGSGLARRYGAKRVYLAGLAANLVSMGLLVASVPFTDDHALAYRLLLVATACLGIGFGLTVPVLNTFTAVFHPNAVDRSVLVLNALLGLGTALAPCFVAVFVGFGFWWGLPVLSTVLLAGVLLVSRPLSWHTGSTIGSSTDTAMRPPIPGRFALYAAFAVLYGICETLNGNWSQLYMTTEVRASATVAAVTLAVFWGAVTAGRVLFALIQRCLPSRYLYRMLPFVGIAAFLVTAALPEGYSVAGVLTFGLAGLGCSALLPLTISFSQEDLVTLSAATAGLVLAAYQVGYGVAAFGAGPLRDAGVSLPTVFVVGAAAAAVLAGLSFVITRPRPHISAAHTQRA
ncbi:MAG: MFS transporter [Pseudonocardia sp.]|nr:MFS transporter [Pseudonocardia sp.]